MPLPALTYVSLSSMVLTDRWLPCCLLKLSRYLRSASLIRSDLEGLHLETKDGYYVLVHEWRNLSEENKSKILALRGEYEGFWLDALRECDEAGLLSMDLVILRRLLNGAISWTSHWFRLNGRISLEELADHVLLLALKSE